MSLENQHNETQMRANEKRVTGALSRGPMSGNSCQPERQKLASYTEKQKTDPYKINCLRATCDRSFDMEIGATLSYYIFQSLIGIRLSDAPTGR